MTAKMDNRLKVKFEQGILLAIPALDLTTLLTLTRTARAFYLAATPYAYRQIALRGVVHYRDLLYILNAEEPSHWRSRSFFHTERLKIMLRGSPERKLQAPLKPWGMVYKGLQNMEAAYGVRMLAQDYLLQPPLPTATNAEIHQATDTSSSQQRNNRSQGETSSSRGSQDTSSPHNSEQSGSGDASDNIPRQTQQQQQQHEAPVHKPFMSQPEIFVNTSLLRKALAWITALRQRIMRQEDPEGIHHYRDLLERLNTDQIPFSQVEHLIISPFEFPATGVRAGQDPFLAPFSSVKHLELHVTSGIISSQVWAPNLKEFWRYTPQLRELSLVYEDGSVFHAAQIKMTTLPPWRKLKSVHVHLRESYSSVVGGIKWRFNEERRKSWIVRIVQQFKEAIKAIRNKDMFYLYNQDFPHRVSCLTLHLPAESTFAWDPREILGTLEEDDNAAEEKELLEVIFKFAEEPDNVDVS